MMDNKPINGHVYLISLKLNESNDLIYKVGKTTKDPFIRIAQYRGYGGYGANTIATGYVDNCHEAEKDLLKIFNDNFSRAIGKEYFTGNHKQMIYLFYNYLSNNTGLNFAHDMFSHNVIDELVIQNTEEKKIFTCVPENSTIKHFVLLTYGDIYHIIKQQNHTIYENSEHTNKIKLYINMNIPINTFNDLEFNEYIEQLLFAINGKIRTDFDITDPKIIVLISDTNDEHMRNICIIYTNVILSSQSNINAFMTHFINQYINMNVYRRKHIEIPNLFVNTKNKYIIHKTFNYDVSENESELFADICICNTDIDIIQNNILPYRLKIKSTPKQKVNKETSATILSRIYLSDFDIRKLIDEQINCLNTNEKLALQKYYFLRFFKKHKYVFKNDKRFIKFYNDNYKVACTVLRFKKYFGKKYNIVYDLIMCNNIHNEYINKMYEIIDRGHDIITDFLNILIYKKLKFKKNKIIFEPDNKDRHSENDISMEYSSEEYNFLIKYIATKSLYYQNEALNRPLFFSTKKISPKYSDDTHSVYKAQIVRILELYGIILRKDKDSRCQANKTTTFNYSLSINYTLVDGYK